MKSEEELVLKVTKEIIVKFIEVGRLSVNSFEEVWNQVHQTVRDSLKQGQPLIANADQKQALSRGLNAGCLPVF